MFTHKNTRIEIDSVGSLIVNQLSYDLKGEPELVNNLDGKACAFRFKTETGGNLKIVADWDLINPFIEEILNVEIGITINSKLFFEGTSWVGALFRTKYAYKEDTSKLQFSCVLSNISGNIESEAGIRQTTLNFTIIGIKIDNEDLLWQGRIGQFAKELPDESRLLIDRKPVEGVLLGLSFENSLEYEKMDVEGSSVSFFVIKGFNEGTVTFRFRIFDRWIDGNRIKKEKYLNDWYEFFFKLEGSETKSLAERVRYVEHPSLKHNYYLFTNFSHSTEKDFIELNLEAKEYQVIDRDKLKPPSTPSPTGLGATSVEIESSPSGIIKKSESPLITHKEMLKQANFLQESRKKFLH